MTDLSNPIYHDEKLAREHLEGIRWPDGPYCPHCGEAEAITKMHGKSHRPGLYKCRSCVKPFTVTVGTLFERSKVPLQTWFYVIFKFTQTRHGVSAKEVERETGVTYKTAWRMCRMIREHMAEIDGEDPLGGEGYHVEVDETMVGGKRSGGKRGRGAPGKTVVFGMIERGGEVMVKVVPNVRCATLQPIIEANVEKGTTVHADELKSYDGLHNKGYEQMRVNHSRGEYVGPNGETVNAIENFWRHLKQGIKGTHIWVSPEHLETYAKEFEYRFNRRDCAETMLSELLSTFEKSGA